MSNEIKLLNAADHLADLQIARGWESRAPQWFRDTQTVWNESFDDFLAASENELLYGVFGDHGITALIRLIPAGGDVFVIHLAAKPQTPLDILIKAGANIKEYLWTKGVQGFYGWIPKQNRSIIKLYLAIGFTDSLIRCYHGQTHGRTIEWRKMICACPEKTVGENLLCKV